MMISHGRSSRSRGRRPVLESLEGRRLMAGGSDIVSLIEFGTNSSRSVSEAAGRQTFTVTRTGDLSGLATVKVRTVAGTALEGYDYVTFQTTLTFAPGQSTATFGVDLVDDKVSESPYKLFNVILFDPAGGAGLAAASTAGVFIMDDEPASTQPLSFFDYGAYGVWTYDAIEGFRKIGAADPQAVVGSSNRSGYLDLGAGGLWAWDALRGVRKLSDADPQQMVVVNNDWTRAEDVLLVDYGAGGLWRYSDSRGWLQLSDVDPRAITVDRQTVFIDFGYGGLWRWGDALPWLKLNDVAPEGMTADVGVLFLDYGSSGLWSWSTAQGWAKVGDGDPQAIASEGDVLYADYGAAGLWSWTDAAGWARLNAADPRSMLSVGGVLYLDFAAFGAWTWTAAAGFHQETGAAVDGLLDSPGAGRVFVDQGAGGLWGWTATGYKRLNVADPDSTGRTA
ncbi:Calx-beta domain-containing protein [Paludisphaera mucosa]|uniref:Calx-beta domain-containing protein n=1 Tax=Paludisphaera mucosa TaxID=3030827 RepID=A0ABT6FIY6_9BACT|nr:Calx-beta domain-containing protein [Paludisphaera mucosa]MDG3007509.1 Calx-beta domain-containing protein [Paludisphaera mucosa]